MYKYLNHGGKKQQGQGNPEQCVHCCKNPQTLLYIGLVLKLDCYENPIYKFPEKELRGLSPNFHIHVSVGFIYSQDRSTHFPATE
jgi:hypothetical protein